MIIKSPHLAYKVMSDLANMMNARMFTLSNHQHVTYIALTNNDGNVGYWSHDDDDCEIVINNKNHNVKQYLHNVRKRRK